MRVLSVAVTFASIVSFISLCISYFGVLRINLQYTTNVEICVMNRNFWWVFNGFYLMIMVCLIIQDDSIFLLLFCTGTWIFSTFAYLSICETDILVMTVAEGLWVVMIIWNQVSKKYRDRPPPLAEPFDAPVAIPASGTRARAAQAREADIAECV